MLVERTRASCCKRILSKQSAIHFCPMRRSGRTKVEGSPALVYVLPRRNVVERVTACLRHPTSGAWRVLLPSLLVYSHLLLLSLLKHQFYRVVSTATSFKTTDGAHYVSHLLLIAHSRDHQLTSLQTIRQQARKRRSCRHQSDQESKAICQDSCKACEE